MKRLILIVVLMIPVCLVSGQKSIDDLFDKYAGRDGFTTVTVTGDLLKLVGCLGQNDKENSLPAKIDEIRILAQDEKGMKVENFYNAVIRDIDLKNYDEFMRVKESNQDLRMLVRSDGNRFREFLLIAGGEDNAVIQIKGNMTYAEARKFSKDASGHHGLNIVLDHK